ncbi:solute carrier family 22 member 6 isoform X3 [Cavia porcellus]|uniref:solute carrier family 22 member 6 isoform X3 n=1 Tax=Cavia porcellus TaxID=10141 RepID=UPI000C87A523|nr:solute carrier family 22 member 6 isoform X2 [Cavia porcellus]
MAFNDLLKQVGAVGRFQQIQVTLVILPMLLMASHNTLQNFTAAIPIHHCRLPPNASLGPDGKLGAWLPQDAQGRPESCLRFATPWREPRLTNDTTANLKEPTEPCVDGWVYDNSTFPSTIVTEWDLVCSHRALRQLAQSLYMVGVLLGAMSFGHLADRFFIESARWLSSRGRLDLTLSTLQRVARINGKQAEGAKLSIEVLRTSLQKELALGKGQASAMDLLRCPALRRLFLCLSMLWFATSFAYYGLVMDLQGFGVSIYLIQVIFGAVDLPAKLVGFLVINYLGRRPAQAASLLLAGICILMNAVIPRDQTIVRTSLAVLGKGCLASSFNCIFLYTGELYPTVIRQTGLGVGSTLARVGSIVSPLVSMTAELYPTAPLFIFGAVPVAASAVTALLPETRGQPLPDTVEDLDSRRAGRLRQQQQEQQKQMMPLQGAAQEKNGL